MPTISKALVKDIIKHKKDLYEYILEPEKYRRYLAGEFLQLTLTDVDASDYWPESRTFSIANAYDKKNKVIKLIIKKKGKYTSKIFDDLNIGSSCTIKYSFGEMILPEFNDSCKIICIAGGTGIAPFFGIIEELKNKNELKRIILYWSIKTKLDLIKFEIIKKNIEIENLNLFVTQEKTFIGKNCRIKQEDILQDINAHYYICGNTNFIKNYKKKLEEIGISKIHIDEWE